jgi:hypothetical protein
MSHFEVAEVTEILTKYIDAMRKRLQRKTSWGRKELLTEMAYAQLDVIGQKAPDKKQTTFVSLVGPPPVEWPELEDL